MKTADELPIRAGVFSSIDQARDAVSGLIGAGFSRRQITVVCSDDRKEKVFGDLVHQHPAGTTTPSRAVLGASIGAIGATAIGLAACLGFGVETSALVAATGSAFATGAIVGALIGAMSSRVVEKELANYYDQSVLNGKILVAAEDTDPHPTVRLDRAADILAEAGAEPYALREG